MDNETVKEIIVLIKDKIDSTKQERKDWDGVKRRHIRTNAAHTARHKRQGMKIILEEIEKLIN